MTPKQRAFVAAYAGNATEAARKAGYTGTDLTVGAVACRLLKKPEVAAAIAARETKRHDGLIATREEIEERLTVALRSDDLALAIKAGGALAKMRGYNLVRHQLEGKVTLEQLVREAAKPKQQPPTQETPPEDGK